jgi:hypothetical protein
MTFGSANDWVLGAGWSLTGGSLVYSGNSTTVASLPLSVLPVTAGQRFQIEIRLSNLSGDTIYVGIGNAYCQLTAYSSTFSITAIAAKALEIQGGSGSTVSVDYIRVAAGGIDGKTVRYGTVDPVATDGVDGDFWINTTSHFIFGPKASGAWPAGTSLVGPAGSGGGGLVLLEQHTASNSASLDFTTAFTSTYDEYIMELVGIIPATNGAVPYLRCSSNGGSTWDTSSVYTGNELHTGASSSSSISYSAQGQWVFFSDGSGSALSSSALPALVGSIHIYDPLSTSKHKRFVFDGIGVYSGNAEDYVTHSSGKYAKTTGVNALRFIMSSGNIASGTIRVYGIAK